MKILLFVTPHLSTGGLPQYLVKKIELLKNDYIIYVIEYSNITGGILVIQRNRIVSLIDKDKFITLGENKFELVKLIKTIQPDVIHFEEIPEFFIPVEICEQIYTPDRKYKIFETSHDSSYDIKNKVTLPDGFLLVSQYQINHFKDLGVPCKLVEYPIDYIPRLDRDATLLELGLDPTYKHVLNVGLFTPRKNQAEVIEYAKRLKAEKIQFHFLGNQAENFEYYWKPLMKDFPSNCKWWNERNDVDKFYSCMDLFIFTSKGTSHDKETNPLVIREAISHQIPSLIYNLPVYLGMYDKYEAINYLENDINVNTNLILDKLELSVKEPNRKKVTIIDAYLTDDTKAILLKDCINSIKALETDIILVSHCPIPPDILKLVDYHLFDKDNTFNINNVYGFRKDNGVEVRSFVHSSHEYPIIRNMRLAFNTAKQLGYDYFYFTEFDHNYSKDDINKIKLLDKQLIKENKDLIFFHPGEAVYGDIPDKYYESCFFAGKLESFLNVFNNMFPDTIEEYNNSFALRFPNCLEHFFYEAFAPLIDKIVLVEGYVKHYFNNSIINVSSYRDITAKIYQGNNGFEYLYVCNENHTPYTFEVFFNNEFIETFTINCGFQFSNFKYIKLTESSDIKINIFDKDVLIDTKYLNYNMGNKSIYKGDGVILFDNIEIPEPVPNEVTQPFNISFTGDSNQLNFECLETFNSLLISIKDIDSKACIYSYTTGQLFPGSSFWCVPLPKHVCDFANDINFGGFLIEMYDKNNCVYKYEIRIKSIPFYKPVMDLTNSEPIFNNYTEFFVDKIYEDLDIDGRSIVVDVGANIGLWTKFILSKNAKKVYCFEPNNKAVEQLKINLKEHNNVVMYSNALYKENTNLTLYTDPKDNSLISSIYTVTEQSEEVDAITLDYFMEIENIERIDLLKLDIEGAEFDILENLTEVALSKIDSILIETHCGNVENGEDRLIAIKNNLIANGFKIYECPFATYIFANRRKKSYYVNNAMSPKYLATKLHPGQIFIEKANLDPDNKEFDWAMFNDGKCLTYQMMYSEMYYDFAYDAPGCSYERYGCRIKDGDIVVDAGANIGIFTNYANERGAAKIYSFEPTDTAYQLLLKNKPTNCTAFKMALGNDNSLLELKTPDFGDTGGASIFNKPTYNNSDFVFSTTIDNLFEQKLFDKIDFLKIDTEGSEYNILKGISDENLAKINNIAMEFHLNQLSEEISDEMWNRLTNAGFKGFKLFLGNGELRIYNFWRE